MMMAYCAVLLVLAPASATTTRRIGWWWDAPATATDPRVDGLVRFATSNPSIMTSVLMRCGPTTLNGSIAGDLLPSCVRAIPALSAIGVESELWLGETDSLSAAIALLSNPAAAVETLIALGTAHKGLTGFNFDLEISSAVNCSTTERCDALFARFLRAVRAGLSKHEPQRWRVTADVDCHAGGDGYAPIMSNCTLLAAAADTVMDMRTYNGGSLRGWLVEAAPALAVSHGVGIGLGVWNDSRTAHTWALTSESAEQRICILLNQSVRELDLFRLKFDPQSGDVVWPYPFWIPQLERFMKGGGCVPPPLPPSECPGQGGWVRSSVAVPGHSGVVCCSLSSKAENRTACDVKSSHEACAEKQCTSTGRVWVKRDYSHFPYTCCAS